MRRSCEDSWPRSRNPKQERNHDQKNPFPLGEDGSGSPALRDGSALSIGEFVAGKHVLAVPLPLLALTRFNACLQFSRSQTSSINCSAIAGLSVPRFPAGDSVPST